MGVDAPAPPPNDAPPPPPPPAGTNPPASSFDAYLNGSRQPDAAKAGGERSGPNWAETPYSSDVATHLVDRNFNEAYVFPDDHITAKPPDARHDEPKAAPQPGAVTGETEAPKANDQSGKLEAADQPKVIVIPEVTIVGEPSADAPKDGGAGGPGDAPKDGGASAPDNAKPAEDAAATGAQAGGSEEGVYSFAEGVLLGDYSGNDSWSALAGQVAGGFVPIWGQIADARDIAHAVGDVVDGKDGAWTELAINAVAIVPGLDALKGVGKVGKEVVEHADDVARAAKHIDEAAEGAKHFGTAAEGTKHADGVVKGGANAGDVSKTADSATHTAGVTDTAAKNADTPPGPAAQTHRMSQDEYEKALSRTFPGHHLDPVLRTVDDVGHKAAADAVADPKFVQAMESGNWKRAGTIFHSHAAEHVRNLPPGSLPPGWTAEAERVVQAGKGGSRSDVLVHGPGGQVLEFDWKTTGKSALSSGSRSEMIRHEGHIKANIGGTMMTQESRSWVDYVRPLMPNGPWR